MFNWGLAILNWGQLGLGALDWGLLRKDSEKCFFNRVFQKNGTRHRFFDRKGFSSENRAKVGFGAKNGKITSIDRKSLSFERPP